MRMKQKSMRLSIHAHTGCPIRHIISVPAGHSNIIITVSFLDYKVSRPLDKWCQSTSRVVDAQELVISKIDCETISIVLLVSDRNSSFFHGDSGIPTKGSRYDGEAFPGNRYEGRKRDTEGPSRGGRKE